MNDHDDLIMRLEEKIAWMQDQLDSQGQELTRALDEIGKLKLQIRTLYQKTGDPYATRDEKDEVPPPHY